MGRHQDRNVLRGVVPVHKMLRHGVNCNLSSNNVLNPFAPFGDCSLIRMANLYANICQVGQIDDTIECFARRVAAGPVAERTAGRRYAASQAGAKVDAGASGLAAHCIEPGSAPSTLGSSSRSADAPSWTMHACYRLDRQEDVQVFSPRPISHRCSCSPEKVSDTLRALGKEELQSELDEHNEIVVLSNGQLLAVRGGRIGFGPVTSAVG